MLSLADSNPPPIGSVSICDRRRATVRLVAVALAVAGALLILGFVDPITARFMPRCPFHVLTGLHCPGCGTLRATHALLNGRVLDALAFNPVFVLSLPWFMLAGGIWASRLIRNDPTPLASSLRPLTIYLIGLCLVLYWIARNIPWSPFTLLAP